MISSINSIDDDDQQHPPPPPPPPNPCCTTVCRFCLEAKHHNEYVRITTHDWPHSEFANMFENITNLQLPTSEYCSEIYCYTCVALLKNVMISMAMFRRAHEFWQSFISESESHHRQVDVDDIDADAKDGPPNQQIVMIAANEEVNGSCESKLSPIVKNELLNVVDDYDDDSPASPANDLYDIEYLDYDELVDGSSEMNAFPSRTNLERPTSEATLKCHNYSLALHMNIHASASLQCDICQEMFDDKNNLMHHMKQVHILAGDNATTNLIAKHLRRQRRRRHHTDTEKEENSCKLCERPYTKRVVLRSHYRRKHANDERLACICLYCNDLLASPAALATHLSNGGSSLKCEVCKAQLKCKTRLLQHRKAHQNMYACDICPKKFIRNDNLKRHIKSAHLGQRSYTCDACGCSFFQRDQLDAHLMTKKHRTNVCKIIMKKE